MSALTLVQCSDCGRVWNERPVLLVDGHYAVGEGMVICHGELVEKRVFFEEDVRPVWEAGRTIVPGMGGKPEAARAAADAFPAPEDWLR